MVKKGRINVHMKIAEKLFLIIFFVTFASCGGVQSGSDSANSDGAAGFTNGPVDIPVTIAKLEAPDVGNIDVEVGGASNMTTPLLIKNASTTTVTITGRAGAIVNPTTEPQVYILNVETNEAQTKDTNADGSFATFTVTGSIDTIVVAGFNGTSISVPVFLKIAEGQYIWILTNSDSLISSSLISSGSTIYMAANGSGLSSLTKAGTKSADSSTSEIIALGIAGTFSSKGTVDCAVDEINTDSANLLVRCDGTFYLHDGTSTFNKSCEVAGTVIEVDYNDDGDGTLYAAVATDTSIVLCNTSTGVTSTLHTLSTCSAYRNIQLNAESGDDNISAGLETKYQEGGPGGGIPGDDFGDEMEEGDGGGEEIPGDDSADDQLATFSVYADMTGCSGGTAGTILVNDQGAVIAMTTDSATGASRQIIDTIRNGDYRMTLSKTVLEAGGLAGWVDPTQVSGLLEKDYDPSTIVNFCSSSFSSLAAYTISSYYGENSIPERMPATSLTIYDNGQRSGYSGYPDHYAICSASETNTVYDAEIHDSAQITCYCADDASGNGQLFAYCPNKMTDATDPDGSEIIQLTKGNEHCNANQNWTCEDSIVTIDNSGSYPQVRIIVPALDPRLSGCLE